MIEPESKDDFFYCFEYRFGSSFENALKLKPSVSGQEYSRISHLCNIRTNRKTKSFHIFLLLNNFFMFSKVFNIKPF